MPRRAGLLRTGFQPMRIVETVYTQSNVGRIKRQELETALLKTLNYLQSLETDYARTQLRNDNLATNVVR